MFSSQSLRQNNRRGNTPGNTIVLGRDQIFLQSFRKRLSFRKKEESPVMRRRTKSQVGFKRKRMKRRSEMIYSNILQIGEDERRRSSGGWVFNYALNRSIMLSLSQLRSHFLNYSPPSFGTFLNGLSIYDSSPHIITRHIQLYKHIKTHEEKHAQTHTRLLSVIANNHFY